MQQKLLHRVVLFGTLLAFAGYFFSGCIDEPTIQPIGQMYTSVRFVHAVPGKNSIDIYLGGTKIVGGVSFAQASKYLNINSGDRQLFVTGAGAPTDTLIDQKVTFASLTQQTIVVYDVATKTSNKVIPALILQTIERYTYSDESTKLGNNAAVKIIHTNFGGPAAVHLAKDAPSDTVITGPLGTNKLPTNAGIVYGTPSPYSYPYKNLAPGTYNFIFQTTAGVSIIPIQQAVAKAKRYTLVLVGEAASPQAIALEDDLPPQ